MNENPNPNQDPISNLNNTPDSTSGYSPQDIDNNKAMAILSYFSLLVLIPVFAAKGSPYARFHANQGLILLVLEVAAWIISTLLGWIPVIGWLLSFAIWVLQLALLALSIIGIVNAAQGRAKELPLLGGIRILQ